MQFLTIRALFLLSGPASRMPLVLELNSLDRFTWRDGGSPYVFRLWAAVHCCLLSHLHRLKISHASDCLRYGGEVQDQEHIIQSWPPSGPERTNYACEHLGLTWRKRAWALVRRGTTNHRTTIHRAHQHPARSHNQEHLNAWEDRLYQSVLIH